MNKIWEINKIEQNKLVQEYCFKDGVILDNVLVNQDVIGSIAHAKMLVTIGIITEKEYKELQQSLVEIIKLNKQNKFSIETQDEDVHTKVEAYLVEKLGDLGKKIHTGRSRNDQVLVDLRLYAKEQLFEIAIKLIGTIEEFLSYAKKYEFIPMPGHTHMQKAMPSSVGMWIGSFVEQYLDLFTLLDSAYILNDQSPLGSGAAYGVSLPLNRSMTAQLLGFSKTQQNSLYCQISRPTVQLAIMQVFVQIMLASSRFAQDVLLFTTNEFNYFTVDESICTGSSIMPQKKNLDIMEYVRAKTHVMIGYEQMVASIAAGLPSGYNADFGETKGPFIKSFELVKQTLQILSLTIKSLKPNVSILQKACTPEIYTTHLAYQEVKKGMAFRDAYQQIGKSLGHLPAFEPVSFLKGSCHIGGTGNLSLASYTKIIKSKGKEWVQKKQMYKKIISLLLKS